jgi:hypothetical protein
VTLRLMYGQYDIKLSYMFNETSKIYKDGKVKMLALRRRSAGGRRSPDQNNETQSNKRVKHDPVAQLESAEDVAAIKQIIITNFQKLDDKEQWTDTKAMACWNQLARDLTMRLTDNKHQGSTSEEHKVKAEQPAL